MANTLVIQLDDADYNTLKNAADSEGTDIEAWLLKAARRALAESPSQAKNIDSLDENGWPVGFFETTYGSLGEHPMERLPQGELETRELVR